MQRALLALPAALLAGLLAAASCQDLPVGSGCFDVPAGGCPLDRGGTCDDPTCPALYSCVNGAWVLAQTCNQPDGGSEAGDAAPDGGGEGGLCTPVNIDVSGQTTDCTPELALPDCPVQAADGCAESACITGCSDFFACVMPGSATCQGSDPCWIDVAYCTDDGQLVITSN